MKAILPLFMIITSLTSFAGSRTTRDRVISVNQRALQAQEKVSRLPVRKSVLKYLERAREVRKLQEAGDFYSKTNYFTKTLMNDLYTAVESRNEADLANMLDLIIAAKIPNKQPKDKPEYKIERLNKDKARSLADLLAKDMISFAKENSFRMSATQFHSYLSSYVGNLSQARPDFKWETNFKNIANIDGGWKSE